MGVDGSVGVLIGMCCGFFVITVVALLLYLRQQDLIRLKDSAITDMELREREWEEERALLADRAAEAEAARAAPVPPPPQLGPDQKSAPPLPAQELQSLQQRYINDTGPAAPMSTLVTHAERRWLRKQTASRLLRLSADSRYRVIRFTYNKWLRFLVRRLGHDSPADRPTGIRFSDLVDRRDWSTSPQSVRWQDQQRMSLGGFEAHPPALSQVPPHDYGRRPPDAYAPPVAYAYPSTEVYNPRFGLSADRRR
eukprot:TRINITY_DN14526_c0_g1_i1.p1 TRINITY_DN14526_c0_g1~~TRINITY_DN14526_c0_g1_i1.p1  ORF type:complete len:252 (+),score=7.19 TRINITY_DN14526_c0_g1_i1:65-820(+)